MQRWTFADMVSTASDNAIEMADAGGGEGGGDDGGR